MGIVVQTKKLGDDRILVCPIEDLTMIDGLISKYKQDFQVSMPDISGKLVETKLVGDGHLVAKWIPLSQSNRVTPPDVVAGETVLIYQYADTDEYHWDTVFNEPSLRRLERVLHMYSNLRTGNKPYDRNSSYWFEVSTTDKLVQLHTSNSDGERVMYDIILNTDSSTLTVKDDQGNSVILDSIAGSLKTVTNKTVDVTTDVVNVHAATEINIKGDQRVNIVTKAAHVVTDTLVADVSGTADINAARVNLKGKGGGPLLGLVNGGSICKYDGNPHVDVSMQIFGTK